MNDISTILTQYCDIINDEWDKVLPQNNSLYKSVVSAMRYSAQNGGKRIRPILLLEFYKLCGGQGLNAVNFALALEMIHTYSLIHDDLPCMDDDDFRRGKPSCHKAYGENIAVLAGDGLLTEAFNYAASTENIPDRLIVKAIKKLAGHAGVDGMIGGQVIDIENEGGPVTAELLREMYALKTGGLIKAAAAIGCILADREDLVPLAEKYAESVGLAFQIVDDILDIEGDQAQLGKPLHSDDKNEKTTLISVYGIDKCRTIINELTAEAKYCIDSFGGDCTFLKQLADYLAGRRF